MLAVNFLSASDLGLTEKEREAHITVLRMLETGELPHVPLVKHPSAVGDEYEAFRAPYPPEDGFNMATFACGTVHCIGGWVERLLGVGPTDASTQAQERLYYPMADVNVKDIDYNDITTDQAASALRNYLTVGEPRWSEVLGL